MTEESLSDKIYNNELGGDLGADILLAVDVKEFIKKLKDFIDSYPENHTITRQLPALFEMKLRELAGKELI